MIVGRKKVVEQYEFDENQIPHVENLEEATAIAKAIKNNVFTNKAKRDVANALLEGYVVTALRASTKNGLQSDVKKLKDAFGDMNAFSRGVARVKAFRGKNPCWRNLGL